MSARIVLQHAICRSEVSLSERLARVSLKHIVPQTPSQTSLRPRHTSFRVPGYLSFHTSPRVQGLDEFFENKKYWEEGEVKCGRPWRKEELRIKSNEDLHKLWYVLLKERNMLLTMEHEYKRECELFPSPERIDKVEESMENLLNVVDERNEAFNLLETGKTGKPDIVEKRNVLGLKRKRAVTEHIIPPYMNVMHKALNPGYRKVMGKYLHLYYEKLRILKERSLHYKNKRKQEILKRFPNAEVED